MKKRKNKTTMKEIFANPYYRGKHIILVGGKLYTAKTGEGANKIIKEVMEKYPDETPQIAYLPKTRTLILWNQYLIMNSLEKLLLVQFINRQQKWEIEIPLAILDSDNIPPIMGRLGFMENFNCLFTKSHKLIISK